MKKFKVVLQVIEEGSGKERGTFVVSLDSILSKRKGFISLLENALDDILIDLKLKR